MTNPSYDLMRKVVHRCLIEKWQSIGVLDVLELNVSTASTLVTPHIADLEPADLTLLLDQVAPYGHPSLTAETKARLSQQAATERHNRWRRDRNRLVNAPGDDFSDIVIDPATSQVVPFRHQSY